MVNKTVNGNETPVNTGVTLSKSNTVVTIQSREGIQSYYR